MPEQTLPAHAAGAETAVRRKKTRRRRRPLSAAREKLHGVDGRSRSARRLRDILQELEAEALAVSPAPITTTERLSMRVAASCALDHEALMARLAAGEEVDADERGRVTRALAAAVDALHRIRPRPAVDRRTKAARAPAGGLDDLRAHLARKAG